MKTKFKLKNSVKENLTSVLIISSLFLTVIAGSILLARRYESLEQQKMTDTSQTYISQK